MRVSATSRAAPTRFLQISLQLAARDARRGNESENDPDDERDAESEGENGRVNANLADARQIAVIHGHDQGHAPVRDQHSERARDRGEQNRFGDELPRQLPAGSA